MDRQGVWAWEKLGEEDKYGQHILYEKTNKIEGNLKQKYFCWQQNCDQIEILSKW